MKQVQKAVSYVFVEKKLWVSRILYQRVCLISISAERICSAYADDKPYSIDLVGAVRCIRVFTRSLYYIFRQVQRQSCFVKKMYDLKWTERDFFWKDEDEVALKHAIARYHA